MTLRYNANKVNMIELLNKLNEPVIKKGKRYKWPQHYSIEFNQNMWYQHSRQRGGLPLEFLKTFFNMDDNKALDFIKNNFDLEKHQKDNYLKKLQVPHPSYTNDGIVHYLNYFRNIDKEIIRTFINNRLIYQEHKYNNILFVGKDRTGTIQHILRRSTHESDLKIISNVEGSKSQFSFNLMGKSQKLYVFESPIDLMSYINLYPDKWSIHSYVALCGLSSDSIHRILKEYHYIDEISLCLDNDIAGIEAAHKIIDELRSSDITITHSLPTFKDFNEDLKFNNGLPAVEGFCEPSNKMVEEIMNEVIDLSQELKPILIKDIRKTFSKFLYTYREDEPISTFTYKSLIKTAAFSCKYIFQQATHLELNLTAEQLKENLLSQGSLHAYINVDKNIRNISYQLTELQKLFTSKHCHTKKDKKRIIKTLMSLTNSLVYTHVFLTLNERKHQYGY